MRRRIVLNGTVLRLEPEIWDALADIEQREGLTLEEILQFAGSLSPGTSLATSVRGFALLYFREHIAAARSEAA